MPRKDDADPVWERDECELIRETDDLKMLRSLFANARERGSEVVEEAANKKLCEVRASEMTNAEAWMVVRDVWRSIVENEELLREKWGKTVFLRGTRRKINGQGATHTVNKIVRNLNPSTMFGDLMELGRPDLLFEAIALRLPDIFDAEARFVSLKRLKEHGINPDDIARR